MVQATFCSVLRKNSSKAGHKILLPYCSNSDQILHFMIYCSPNFNCCHILQYIIYCHRPFGMLKPVVLDCFEL